MRIASIFNGDTRRILEAIELLYSIPGAPVMYYGDEIGMQNLPTAGEWKDSRRYVRGPFDWKAAEAQEKDPDSLLNQVSQIVRQSNQMVSTPSPSIGITSREVSA